ncbi:MAG: GNAT family N-acetyltransferase [Candidatus Dojkabacteria bacterium]
MKIKIRPATIKDYESVMEMYANFVGDISGDYDRYKAKDGDSFHRVLDNDREFIDLALADDQIAGYISYSIRDVIRYPAPIVEVEEFYVDPKYRRNKIATKLMENVLEFSRKQKAYRVFLASAAELKAAHKFYESIGFDQYAFHFRRKP